MKVKCIKNRNAELEPLILPIRLDENNSEDNFVVCDLEATRSFDGLNITVDNLNIIESYEK